MLYKHYQFVLALLLINHDETVKLHRTNTNIPGNGTTPLPCSLTHNLEFQFDFSGVVITNTPSNPSWNQDALDRTHKFLKINFNVPILRISLKSLTEH